MGDVLPSSDCIILSALGCEQREREAISCCKVFLFHHSIALPQSHSSSQLMGSITLSFWRGGREIYPEQQQHRLPQPDDYSESAGSTSFFFFFLSFSPCFAYLHSSPLLPLDCSLLWTNPLPLKNETHHVVVWLWSGATIPIMLHIFASPQ